MKKVSESQEVDLFQDEEAKGQQSVIIDASDDSEPWISVSHSGNELSMSVKNWDKLVTLVDSAKSKING